MSRKAIIMVYAVAAIFLLGTQSLLAQSPNTITYQGKLTNATGAPITTATNVVFRIYAAASGGSALWTETHNGVTPDANGVFTRELGATTAFPATLFDGSKRYLGITVGSDAEMTPRQVLNNAPYAFAVENVPGIAASFKYEGFILSTTTAAIDSVTINCPTAGYVNVYAQGYINIGHTSGGGVQYPRIYVSHQTAIGDFDNFAYFQLPSALPTGTYSYPWSIIQSVAVSAGANKFYVTGDIYSGGQIGTVSVARTHLVATFYPVAYGTFESTLSPAPPDPNSPTGELLNVKERD